MIEEKIKAAATEANRQLEAVLEGRNLSEYLIEVEGKVEASKQKYYRLIADYGVGGEEFSDLVGHCIGKINEEVRKTRSKIINLVHKSRVMNNYDDFSKELLQVEKAAKASEEDREHILSSVYGSLLEVAKVSKDYKQAIIKVKGKLIRYQEKIAGYDEEKRMLDRKYNRTPERGKEISKMLKMIKTEKTEWEDLQISLEEDIEMFAPRVVLYEAACCLMGKDPQDEIRKLEEKRNLKMKPLPLNEGYSESA